MSVHPAESNRRDFAARLSEQHFSRQSERAADLRDVEITALEPVLRVLLFTDGTVTRSLEADTLSPVAVQPLEQVTVPAPAAAASFLEIAPGVDCIRRRVAMRIGDAPVGVWAESFLLLDRLPRHFVERMGASTTGIGGSLQQLKLESWRELLCFGLGAPPAWAGEELPSSMALTRLYRICTVGMPALLISETFAVESIDGSYRLIGPAGPNG